ncbi:MAG TPA: hypothetical protein DCQ29_08495, partial [Chitinophagaceae bacterium]|nr:hypothetical protein [Chitinophagaceae bacterium]
MMLLTVLKATYVKYRSLAIPQFRSLSFVCVLMLNVLISAAQSNGLHFDGTNDFVNFSTSITNLNKADFTIEAWVKTTATSCGIVNCSNGNTSWETGEKVFFLNSQGRPTFVGWGNDFINSSTAVNDGNWHHIAVVWDYSGSGTTGTPYIYVDGVNTTASSNYVANNDNLGTFKLGMPNYWGSEAPNFFSGSLDDVRIWNVARTQTEIQNNKDAELVGNEAGLVGYFKLNEGVANSTNTSTTTTADATSFGNSGTLTN